MKVVAVILFFASVSLTVLCVHYELHVHEDIYDYSSRGCSHDVWDYVVHSFLPGTCKKHRTPAEWSSYLDCKERYRFPVRAALKHCCETDHLTCRQSVPDYLDLICPGKKIELQFRLACCFVTHTVLFSNHTLEECIQITQNICGKLLP